METIEKEFEEVFYLIDGKEVSEDEAFQVVAELNQEKIIAVQEKELINIANSPITDTNDITPIAQTAELPNPLTLADFEKITKKVIKKVEQQKTHFLPDVKEITPTELVPTLWGATQLLMQKVEERDATIVDLTKRLEKLEAKKAKKTTKNV